MQSSALGCDLPVASLTAMVTVVVTDGGGYAADGVLRVAHQLCLVHLQKP